MKKFVLALGLGLGLGLATLAPAIAGGLVFEPVAPEGLDAKATQMVKKLQAGLPGQMAMFEQAGYSAYGALAVPKGMELKPELLASAVNAETADAARSAVLEACAQQNGAECTVIGLILPGT